MQNKNYTLPEKLAEITKKFPKKIALQIKEGNEYKKYTFQDLHTHALSIAHALINIGIRKNDRVAIVLENRPEWAFIYFGIMFAEATAVPLDSQSTTEDLKYFFADSECKIVFSSEKLKSTVVAAGLATETLQNVVLLDTEETNNKTIPFSDFLISSYAPPEEPDTRIDHNDIASILYTSGTTGKPKGVMLTHDNFYSNFRSIEHLDIFAEDHNFLSILPLHHSFPFMATLLIPLFTGNTVSYITSLKKEEITDCMQKTGVSLLIGVPQFFYLFYHGIENKMKSIPFFIRLPLFGMINLFHMFRKLTDINLNKLMLKKVHDAFG